MKQQKTNAWKLRTLFKSSKRIQRKLYYGDKNEEKSNKKLKSHEFFFFLLLLACANDEGWEPDRKRW